jgi:hypothetical protein
MTFPRRAQRQALHGTAVGVSEHRRLARVGGQLVSTHQHARTDAPFGAAAAVSAVDFMGGRSGSSHVTHVGRHRAAHRTGTVVPALPERKPDASLAEPAEAAGFVGARSSRHGEGQ